ncbi:MAG: hypothetical protein ACK417_10620 [Bacteroidia bacterium]
MPRSLVIRLTNEQIALGPDTSLPVGCSNLPMEHMRFRSFSEVCWRVEMLAYQAQQGILQLRVIDYQCKDSKAFEQQIPKAEVRRLQFEKLDWAELQGLLSSYQKSKLLDFLTNLEARPFALPDFWKAAEEPKMESEAEIEAKYREFTLKLNWQDVIIKTGHAFCSVQAPDSKTSYELRIYNDYLLPEFDAIKLWFAKKLKANKVVLKVSGQFKQGHWEDLKATSEIISKIGPELLQSIRYQRAWSLTKAPERYQPDKSLFTTDDIFDAFSDTAEGGNAFQDDESSLLQMLLDQSNIKNRKQLAFLAGKQAPEVRLRYTLHPHFGFLFCVRGERGVHFVWELLNTHATYIWSADAEGADLPWAAVEATINSIRIQGRDSYKRGYTQNPEGAALLFNIITHEHRASDFIDDFPKWKHRLLELLV